MNKLIHTIGLICLSLILQAQNIQPEEIGFGQPPILNEQTPCITEEQRVIIWENITANIEQYGMKSPDKSRQVSLQFPVKQAMNYNDYGAIGISNFVDLNPNYPNQLTDYNCGTRSYDLESGYNHQGTDVFSWPFSWTKMDNDQVEIIAAAPGTIIYKEGSNQDKSCSFNGTSWNAVYVQHSDGSIAWYGHLKTNSLTSKAVGEQVEVGEFLGVMGSSGISTGPHLHFELYDAQNNLIDPYAGGCNNTTTTSWWADQEDYYVSGINALHTHSSAPAFGCYGDEYPNIEVNFDHGETIYFATYFRDQLQNVASSHRILKPDGSTYTQWNTTSDQFYSGSYWYRSFTMPGSGDQGEWTFEVTLNGLVYSQHFYLGEFTPEITFSENELAFGEVTVGETKTGTFTIENNSNSGMLVESISYPEGFSGNWSGLIDADESKTITVTFEPSREGEFSGEIVVNSNATGDNSLDVSGGQKQTQSISFEDIDDKTYGEDPFALNATSTSGLAVSYSVVQGPITINGSMVTIEGTGEATIEASQLGNDVYEEAQSVSKSFTINKAIQLITFDPIPDKVPGDEPFEVIASSSSSLDLVLTISGPATIDGTTITLTDELGTVTITAFQSGNENYLAAEATLSFEVAEPLAISPTDAVDIYPNPAEGMLFARSHQPLVGAIISLDGKLLQEFIISEEEPLDISAIKSGLYLLELRLANTTLRKIIRIK